MKGTTYLLNKYISLQTADSLRTRTVSSVLIGFVFDFLVHGQVTIIFVVSVCLFVCLFVCAEFFQPSSIRFGSN